jgi:stage V sporulation protein B
MGICVLAKPILELLFSSRNNEIEIVSESLSYLGIGVIFLALSFPLFSIFQGTGKAVMPLKIMLVGVAVKFIANIILIPIPWINISGAGISTDLCYLAIMILSVIFIQKHTGIKLNLIKILFPSAYGGLLCSVTAVLVYDITEMTIPSILCGGIIYLISVYLSDSKFFIKKSI